MNKLVLIVIGIVFGIVILISGIFITTNNKAINLEEQIKGAEASIQVQQKRRVDLILNLVDAVKSYNKYEQSTLEKIVEARSQASNGNVEEAQLVIKAVAEQYPELKSNDNYKQLMTELAVTENLIAEHRNNYNQQVKDYNKFTRSFPNSMILGMMGYEKIDTKYTEYKDATVDSPKNLFGE